MDRRAFLHKGLLGSLLLPWGGCGRQPSNAWPGRGMMAALLPAILQGAPGTWEAESVLAGVEQARAALSPLDQAELDQLFGLLSLSPLRWAFCGFATDWGQVSPAQAHAMLDAWFHSRFRLLQSAAEGLCELVLASHYASPGGALAAGYQPPRIPVELRHAT